MFLSRRPMPMHRRRVYFDHSYSRRARIEGWLTLSIFLSAAVLLVCLLCCLSEASSTLCWLPSKRLSRLHPTPWVGTSVVAGVCENLMMVFAAGLVLGVTL